MSGRPRAFPALPDPNIAVRYNNDMKERIWEPDLPGGGSSSSVGVVRDVLSLVVGYTILAGGAIALYALVASRERLLGLLGWVMGALCAALAGYLCVAVAGQVRGGPTLGLALGATGALSLLAFGAHGRGAWSMDAVVVVMLGAALLGGLVRHHQDQSIRGVHPDYP